MRGQDTIGKSWIVRVGLVALFVIWAAGLQDAILGGLQPGHVRHPWEKPYPSMAVWTVCLIISAEFILLLIILRPFTLFARRVFLALVISGSFLIADFLMGSGWTDQAGYCYSNLFFLSMVIGFLGIVGAVRGTELLLNKRHLRQVIK